MLVAGRASADERQLDEALGAHRLGRLDFHLDGDRRAGVRRASQVREAIGPTDLVDSHAEGTCEIRGDTNVGLERPFTIMNGLDGRSRNARVAHEFRIGYPKDILGFPKCVLRSQ